MGERKVKELMGRKIPNCGPWIEKEKIDCEKAAKEKKKKTDERLAKEVARANALARKLAAARAEITRLNAEIAKVKAALAKQVQLTKKYKALWNSEGEAGEGRGQ